MEMGGWRLLPPSVRVGGGVSACLVAAGLLHAGVPGGLGLALHVCIPH